MTADNDNAEGKTWSGWRRLWVVVSVLCGLPILVSALIPYTETRTYYDIPDFDVPAKAYDAISKDMPCESTSGSWKSKQSYHGRSYAKVVSPALPMPEMIPLSTGEEIKRPHQAPKELWGKQVVQRLFDVTVECPGQLPQHWWWMAALPGLLLGGVGLTGRWVYRGFKQT